MTRPAEQLDAFKFPGFVRGSDTSYDAARSVCQLTGAQRKRVFAVIERHHPAGVTCDAIEEALDGRHQAISARVKELLDRGHVIDSGRRAPTRSRRMARLYVLPDPTAQPSLEKPEGA